MRPSPPGRPAGASACPDVVVYASDGSLITELHATEDRVVLTAGPDAAVGPRTPSSRSRTGGSTPRRRRPPIDPARALAVDIAHGRVVEGGSTITQQLVKNLYTGRRADLRRKIDEAALAVQMEQPFTKDEILTDYLNTVYFGEGAYGIEAAAETYFGVHASELDLSESATLAGLITAPNHFDPLRAARVGRGPARRGAADHAIEMGTITPTEQRQARRGADQRRAHRHQPERYPFPYFVDYFKRWFLSNPAFGKTYDDRYRLLFTGGLRITTTLDPAVQAARENAVHQRPALPERPGRGGHGGRPADRLRPGDGRRQGRGLLGEHRRGPREPRHRRGRLGPADGLGVQGVRAGRGARERLLPRLDVRRAGLDHPAAARRRHLAR